MLRCAILAVLVSTFFAGAQSNITELVCLSDSSGREVSISAGDSSVTFQDAIKVTHITGGFTIILKNGDSLFLKNPPFRRVYVSMKTEPVAEKVDSTKEKKTDDRKDKKSRK
jgi:hypothetical protein